tara:strand:- start:195 stop:863 length:669 start_codon:yes stop_codon:yes gene_type:complete
MNNKILIYDLCGRDDIRFSPPCWNIKLCLIHNKIDFETIPIKFTEKSKILFSSQKLVPILKYNEEVIYDSWDIFCWLNEKFKELKLISSDQNKIFSKYLYFYTSKHLLPLIFQIIGNDIPKILDEEDKKYFLYSREKRLGKPLESLLQNKSEAKNKLFNSLLIFEKILKDNKFINGIEPGLPDFIFFGNFMWAEKCSSENLFENTPNINNWYSELKAMNDLN